ncbi:MAG: hypothetical protein QXQ50_04505 [Candidatus Bathyarchaeia archaeon]
MQREYEYIIIHIPLEAIIEAINILGPRLPPKIVFSMSSEIPPANTIKEEIPPFPKPEHQQCRTVKLPITETNDHKKLRRQYCIQLDLYYKEEKSEKYEKYARADADAPLH